MAVKRGMRRGEMRNRAQSRGEENVLQEKGLKREQTGKGEGRNMMQTAEEHHIKVEGQGWRRKDQHLLMITNILYIKVHS